MTGEVTSWAPFVMSDELAVRMEAGEMAALAEFVEANRRFLTAWARKVLRRYPNVIPANEYEPDDCINQIFADFLYYDYTNVGTLLRSIFRSYVGIAHGGIHGKRVWHKGGNLQPVSLDAPVEISSRSGDRDDGETLGELIASKEPRPDEVLEQREHVEELAPQYYHEIKKIFGEASEEQGGATIGEILAFKNGNAFRDVIEEIFRGYLFKQVRAMALREE